MGKKKKEVLDAEYVRLRGGHAGQRLQRRRDQDAVGHPGPVLRLRVQQGALAAYGLVSYWTAYLKANYPAEYMAALLTSVGDDKDKSALYLNECRRMGIKVLPPDVNESVGQLRRRRHRHPLRPRRDPQRRHQRRRRRSSRAREEKGRFAAFNDFLRKVAGRGLQQADHRVADQGRRVRLARPHPAGPARACTRRPSTRSSTSSARRPSARTTCSAAFGDDAAGDSGGDLMGLTAVPGVEWDKPTLLAFEREMLGLYVSDHPLFGLEHVLAAHADTSIAALTGDDAASPTARTSPSPG